jgi:hypothetical protein
VRAVEKITKGLERENGLGVELLGQYGLPSSGSSTPDLGSRKGPSTPKINGVDVK